MYIFRIRIWLGIIAANILVPANFDEAKKYPTIISIHPFGSCKAQTSGNVYGKTLAEAGYVVLAYDASFQGESGGSPRWIEDPTQRVEDISRVIDYAVTLPYVDADRIGLLGICSGGGYAINATLTEKRIQAVVSISGLNVGRLFREGFSDYDPLGALKAMAAQRTLAWDAFAETLLTQPIMVIIGQKVGAFGAFRDGMEIYGRANASKDRQLVSLADFSHYDLYDKPKAVR
ncbi:alpha/beta hydrolase [Yersinia vastinensis]|uniref:alpha/beta hydrolase n=1 Tax=Yersinia vastinensis TaxID=2890318 RepID=UPI00191C8EB4